MIDKLMSRRCLIEAAAGALLLSGCSVQEDSSTKKVKKQDEIKKAVDFIGGMDIRAVSERVMHELFKALAMRFEFTL